MQRHLNKKLEWLTFDLLSNIPRLMHGMFTRHGGTSTGPYSSLNLAFCVGDDPFSVQSNIERVKNAFGISEIKYAHQSHGVGICQIDHQTPQNVENYDALMTNILQIGMMIKHADCQAAIFYDPIHHAVSNVHSGWRGSVQNIYAHTIQAMKRTYGSKPEDLLVCISPSLGPQAAEFIHYRKELPLAFWEYQVKPNYFDFWAISEMQLKACGILPHHIEIARMCTYSNASDFFSFRRKPMKGTPGGHGAHGTVVVLT
jgi:YfiH family protein